MLGGLVLRQPIYGKDRMDPVDPSARLDLDSKVLDRFPEGYRHLAYLRHHIGYPVHQRRVMFRTMSAKHWINKSCGSAMDFR